MSQGYQIRNQSALYFLTLQVIDWIDIFSRQAYRDIILESFSYCRQHKGLRLWAYVIMTNHLHLIVSADNSNLSDVIRDFKRFTATKILKTIDVIPESRRTWMLRQFALAANKHRRNSKYQFWTHENHAVELESSKFIFQKMNYIHQNPVRAGFVENAEDWMFSSQRNYAGMMAPVEIDLL